MGHRYYTYLLLLLSVLTFARYNTEALRRNEEEVKTIITDTTASSISTVLKTVTENDSVHSQSAVLSSELEVVISPTRVVEGLKNVNTNSSCQLESCTPVLSSRYDVLVTQSQDFSSPIEELNSQEFLPNSRNSNLARKLVVLDEHVMHHESSLGLVVSSVSSRRPIEVMWAVTASAIASDLEIGAVVPVNYLDMQEVSEDWSEYTSPRSRIFRVRPTRRMDAVTSDIPLNYPYVPKVDNNVDAKVQQVEKQPEYPFYSGPKLDSAALMSSYLAHRVRTSSIYFTSSIEVEPSSSFDLLSSVDSSQEVESTSMFLSSSFEMPVLSSSFEDVVTSSEIWDSASPSSSIIELPSSTIIVAQKSSPYSSTTPSIDVTPTKKIVETKVEVVTEKAEKVPVLIEPVKQLKLDLGRFLYHPLPPKMFINSNGDTKDLRLQLLLGNRMPLPASSWLQLSRPPYALYGVPWDRSLLRDPHEFVIRATNSHNQTAENVLTVQIVEGIATLAKSHEFFLTISAPYDTFVSSIDHLVYLMQKVVGFLGLFYTRFVDNHTSYSKIAEEMTITSLHARFSQEGSRLFKKKLFNQQEELGEDKIKLRHGQIQSWRRPGLEGRKEGEKMGLMQQLAISDGRRQPSHRRQVWDHLGSYSDDLPSYSVVISWTNSTLSESCNRVALKEIRDSAAWPNGTVKQRFQAYLGPLFYALTLELNMYSSCLMDSAISPDPVQLVTADRSEGLVMALSFLSVAIIVMSIAIISFIHCRKGKKRKVYLTRLETPKLFYIKSRKPALMPDEMEMQVSRSQQNLAFEGEGESSLDDGAHVNAAFCRSSDIDGASSSNVSSSPRIRGQQPQQQQNLHELTPPPPYRLPPPYPITEFIMDNISLKL